MGKYSLLTKYLLAQNKTTIKLTFSEINKIIEGSLPPTAYKLDPIWNNSHGGPLSRSWLDAGYIVAFPVDKKNEIVLFDKNADKAKSFLSNIKVNITPLNHNNTIKLPIQNSKINIDISLLIDKASIYFNQIQIDNHARYLSWEHCYSYFQNNHIKPNEETLDWLCLHLAWYLASWGMLHNSFLLQKDYKIHYPIVKLITVSKYQNLYNLSIDDLCNRNITDQIIELSNEISFTYQKEAHLKKDVTDTLKTKILLGTMGCVPAYDIYFKKGLTITKAAKSQYCTTSLLELANLYRSYQKYFDSLKKQMSHNRIEYPPMKILDMCFWQLGIDQTNFGGENI